MRIVLCKPPVRSRFSVGLVVVVFAFGFLLGYLTPSLMALIRPGRGGVGTNQTASPKPSFTPRQEVCEVLDRLALRLRELNERREEVLAQRRAVQLAANLSAQRPAPQGEQEADRRKERLRQCEEAVQEVEKLVKEGRQLERRLFDALGQMTAPDSDIPDPSSLTETIIYLARLDALRKLDLRAP